MTPKKVFSSEFREIFKNSFFKQHIQTTTENIDDKDVNSNKKKHSKGEFFTLNTLNYQILKNMSKINQKTESSIPTEILLKEGREMTLFRGVFRTLSII